MTVTRTLLVAAAFSLAALCLAACADAPAAAGSAGTAQAAVNPLELYPLKAGPATDKIALAIHPEGLDAAQSAAVRALAARRADAQGGPVVVSVPGGADLGASARVVAGVRRLLSGSGVPAGDIRATTYDGDPKAPLLVSFDYEKPEIAKCGKAWGDLAQSFDNAVYDNFGCAVTANMAAQIANPNDLVHPHTEDAPDAERRLTVLDKYRAGKATTADPPPAQSGALIAHVGQ